MSLQIRRTRSDETDLLCKLDEIIFGEEDGFTTPDLWEGLETFLIFNEGAAIGSIALRHNTDVSEQGYEDDYIERAGSMYLVSIGVLPEWQGNGIGKVAMAWLVDYGREQGFERIVSNARSSNQRSINLHVAIGFRITKTIPNWYGSEGTEIFELKL